MLTIEKVALLRAIDIFAGTPDFVLAAVADIAEEIDLDANASLIEEGALGDCLYVVIEGEARVHSRGQTIITLGPGQSVGELAVLDPEPRSASVPAVGPTRLFKIAKAHFDEVMADRPEIAQGVIRALCQRVRAQGRIMAEMQTKSRA